MLLMWAASQQGAQSSAQPVIGFADAMIDYRLSALFQNAAGTTPAAINDPVGFAADLSGHAPAVNPTDSARPIRLASGLSFDGTNDRMRAFQRHQFTSVGGFTCPDLPDSVPGKGFTCTGLTLDTSDDTLWYGNDGRSAPSSPTYNASLVNVSLTGELIDNIDIKALFPSSTSVQGVVYDASDDTLWFCSKGENLVRHVGKDGTDIGSFAITNPNGIAINTTNGTLIVTIDSGDIYVFDKAGVQQGTMFNMGDACDQVSYDSATGLLYYTKDSAAEGAYIGVYHLATRQFYYRWMVPQAEKIEGIVFHDGVLYVNNDAYFHSGTAGVNQTVLYDLAPMAWTPATQITLWAKFTAAAPSGTRPISALNSGSANAGAGMWMIGSSSTGVRLIINSGAGTTERDSVDFTGLPDMATAYRYVVCEIDTAAKEVRLWADGVQYGGTKALTNVTGGISIGLMVLASAENNSNELACTGKAYGAVGRLLTSDERSELNTYLASIA